jgi:transcription elongation factor GreA
MPDETVTLRDAARRYFDSLPDDERAANQPEVERFVRWCGADRRFEQLRGQEVANYAETLTGTLADPSARADAVRRFLAFAKKEGFSESNLGTHLRLRKGSARAVPATKIHEIEMSAEEKAALEAELAALKAQRPRIVSDIQRAMADKDFRENAPLDAAKQQQGHIEGRILNLENRLAHAVVVETGGGSGQAIEIGTTVHLRNMTSGAETVYTLVRPGEVNARQGRISFESPVGRALLQRRAGDEVEVSAPSGTLRFRIERVEH